MMPRCDYHMSDEKRITFRCSAATCQRSVCATHGTKRGGRWYCREHRGELDAFHEWLSCKIYIWRQRARLTQAEVEQRMGCYRGVLTRVEMGAASLTSHWYRKACQVFGENYDTKLEEYLWLHSKETAR